MRGGFLRKTSFQILQINQDIAKGRALDRARNPQRLSIERSTNLVEKYFILDSNRCAVVAGHRDPGVCVLLEDLPLKVNRSSDSNGHLITCTRFEQLFA